MTYLINAVNTYRVPTVEDALELREELSSLKYCELESFSYTTKYNKKTEEEYQLKTLQKKHKVKKRYPWAKY